MKVACTVWSGGKARDDIRGLPITIEQRFCPHAQPGGGRPGYPCETAQHLPAADELRHPFRSGRGAFVLWQRHSALCRPFPERYGAVPGNDDEAGGSGRRMILNFINGWKSVSESSTDTLFFMPGNRKEVLDCRF